MGSRPQLSTDRRREIVELAEFIADECFPGVPIEPADLIRRKHLTLSFGRYGDSFDGMLECREQRFHVYCNLDRVMAPDAPRARFTLGHELGHFFTDAHRLALLRGAAPHGSCCEYESDILTEQEADTFAAGLLLPQRRFARAAGGAERGLAGVLALARDFGTSITATAIRYAQTDVIPCLVIKWHPEGYGWKWISPSLYRDGYRKTIEQREGVPSDSATGRVFAGEPPPAGPFHRCGSTAALWFPFVADGSNRNVILWEEAISLGRFGALTVLYPEGR